jgi:Tfp pilus assembly protein PilV
MSAPKRTSTPLGAARNPEQRRSPHRLGAAAGFSLIEVLIAALVLVAGMAAFFNMLNLSVHATASTRAREGATNLAREILEDARTISYAQISPTDIVGELQAMNGLASSTEGGTWTISRRGYTYTISASECSIDDPKDEYGAHDSTFCSYSGTTGTKDLQPADLKRITVDVKWTSQGHPFSVHQVETLTAAGQTVGLAASGLVLISPTVSAPTAPVITNAAVTELRFAVQAPAAAAAMDWTLEGVRQSPAPALKAGSTREWVFTWKIPYPSVSDGTYQVAAQAIDATGVEGPPVSISVTLIRGVPAAPKGVVGGFNTIYISGSPNRAIELQWQANSERNVIGYRVYGPSGLVCPRNGAGEPSLSLLSLALSCIDLHPPAYSASNITYEVVALYREAQGETLSEKVSQGPATVLKVPSGEPPSPNAPTTLEAKKNGDGSVTLKWSVPSGTPAPAFYRIYRGSTDYTGRYDLITPGSATSYIDANAVATHSYWVTAVTSSLTESPFTGPVTG